MKYIPLQQAILTKPILDYLAKQNVPLFDLLKQAKLPQSVMENMEQIIPTYPSWVLLQLASDHLQVDDIGFKIDADNQLNALKSLLPIFKHDTQTLHEGLLTFIHQITKMVPNGVFWFSYTEQGTWFYRSNIGYFNTGLQAMEQATFAIVLRIIRIYLGDNWTPPMITLQQDDKNNVFKRYFPKATISDNNRYTGIYIPNKLLGTARDEFLNLTQHESIIPASFFDNLYLALHAYRRQGYPKIKELPDIVGMSVQQIQRRLAKEGKTFKQVIEKLKYDIAKEWLVNCDYKITDIATALSYSSPGHFTRAFKQWSGQTPLQYRKANRLLDNFSE